MSGARGPGGTGPFAFLLVVVLGGMGCTRHLRPGEFAIDPASIPAIRTEEPIAVSAGTIRGSGNRMSVGGFTVTVDYLEYTDAAVARLRRELVQSGTTLSADARKTLRLAVVSVAIVQSAGGPSCVIEFTVQAGEGYRKGLQARAHSWNYEKACNAAVSNVVVVTLNDQKVRAYLAEPIGAP